MIGGIDPAMMRDTEAGLYVEGSVDILDSDIARQAWRSVKKGRIGMSFGFLTLDDRVGADGVKELLEIDLFEITLTPTPANPDAVVLSTESLDDVRVRRFEA